ncbi:MAG: hypothetical protein JSS44_13150 [Proteobacteria bacterium]|nr:hypothetical protein [Pseudomonadota bacterium]
MNIRIASVVLASLIPCVAIAAGSSAITVRGEFIYGKDNDAGIIFKICPDKASRRANRVLAKHECFIARNVHDVSLAISKGLGIGVPVSGDDVVGQKGVFCDEYDGTGVFTFSNFKAREQMDAEEGGIITVADANIDSYRDVRLLSKQCGTFDEMASGNLHEIKVTAAMQAPKQSSAPAGTSARRVPYTTVFRVNRDGSVSPRVPIRFKGISMSGNQSFTRGVSFNGVDFAAMQGHDISVVRNGEWWDIQGFY